MDDMCKDRGLNISFESKSERTYSVEYDTTAFTISKDTFKIRFSKFESISKVIFYVDELLVQINNEPAIASKEPIKQFFPQAEVNLQMEKKLKFTVEVCFYPPHQMDGRVKGKILDKFKSLKRFLNRIWQEKIS